MHERSCFLTLTYRPDALPVGGSLVPRHLQLFLKRLRRGAAGRVSFFACGEYGDEIGRPHYHACVFGFDFEDKRPWKKAKDGSQLFVSAKLDALWGHGFTSIGSVTFESAAYVARYCLKKVSGVTSYEIVDPDTGEVSERLPEFVRMSLRPAIGKTWLERYGDEVARDDTVVSRGVELPPPRYYDKQQELGDPANLAARKLDRMSKALARKADLTPERLEVRRKVKLAQVGLFKREVE